MTPKRQLLPPTHTETDDSTSSDDSDLQPQQESQDSSESESDSSSDKTHNPLSPQPKKPVSKPHQDSSESDSDKTHKPVSPQPKKPVSKPHQESSESDSDKTHKPLSPQPKKPVSKPHQESSELTHKPLSPQPKKPKPTQLKTNGKKRPVEIDQVTKSKKRNGADKVEKGVEKVDKSKGNVGSESAEKVEKDVEKVGSKSDKGKGNVGSDSAEKVEKSVDKMGSKSVDKGKGKVSNGEEEEEGEDKKVGFFARLFTEKDEIALLEGMIQFKENNQGVDPSLNILGFHEFVKNSLSCSVTKTQVADKIRRLKKKYVNHFNKVKGGKDSVILRPHEFKLFELSKKIWGSEGLGSQVNGDSKVKNTRSKMDNKGDNAGKSEVDWWSLYPLLCASLEAVAVKIFNGPLTPKEYVKKVVSGLNKDKARELEQEWKDLSVMEHQVYARRVKVTSKQAEAVLTAIQH